MVSSLGSSILTRWKQWVEPLPSVQDEDVRRQSRFLASLLLAVIIAVILLIPMLVLPSPLPIGQNPELFGATVAILVLFSCYHATRHGFYRSASAVAIIYGTAAILFMARVLSGERGIHSLDYLLAPIIFASLLLPLRGAIITLVVNCIAILGLSPLMFPSADLGVIVAGPFSLVLFMGVVSLLVAYHWKRLEDHRQVRISESEERYRIITELISDYAFSFAIEPDNSIKLEWITETSFRRLTGYDPKDVKTGGLFAFHPDEQAAIRREWEETIHGRTTISEHRIIKSNGEILWIHFYRKPIWDTEGKRVVRFYGVAQDITKRKQAELALRESEERYRVISETISDYAFVMHVEPDGKLVRDWITESVSHVTGYSVQEVQSLPYFGLYHPDDIPKAIADLESVKKGDLTSNEYRILTKSGQIRWVRMFRRPIWDEHEQRFMRFYAIAQDITDFKQAEAQKLRLALEQERMTMVNQFVLAFSHDVRTSLATIENSRYLIERLATNSEQPALKTHLDKIRHSVGHLTEQLDNLHMVSSLSDPTRVACQLNRVVSSLVAEHHLRAAQKRQTISVSLDPLLPMVQVDEAQLSKAIQHILLNALFHTDEGGEIMLRTYHNNEYVVVEVRDSGKGIDPQKLPLIFEPFYKIDQSRTLEGGGLGLGLSIVKMVVEAHAGEITVESELGQGSVFMIFLPLTSQETFSNGRVAARQDAG